MPTYSISLYAGSKPLVIRRPRGARRIAFLARAASVTSRRVKWPAA